MSHLPRIRWLIAVSSLGLAGVSYVGHALEQGGIANAKSPKERQTRRDEFLKNFKRVGMNTTPGDATFLRIMVKAMNAKRGVEVGTATGYGAMHMGMGFEQTGGHLITIDINPEMVKAARANLKSMALEETVTVFEGDALEVLPKLEGKFDFVFLDAVKQDYLKYFKLIEPKLMEQAVIVADNVIRSRRAVKDFLDTMEQDLDYDMAIIRCSEMKGDGMAVIHKMQ